MVSVWLPVAAKTERYTLFQLAILNNSFIRNHLVVGFINKLDYLSNRIVPMDFRG
jgi:hypothetical protein